MRAGFGVHPVSTLWLARSWAPSPCCIVRMRVTIFIRLAISGISSQTCTPSRLEEIALKSPRFSDGASGLGSNVSCCGGPPAM